MKKTIFMTLFLVMVLCACGKGETKTEDKGTPKVKVETELNMTEQKEAEQDDTKEVDEDKAEAKEHGPEVSDPKQTVEANATEKKVTKTESVTAKQTEQKVDKEVIKESENQEKTVQKPTVTSTPNKKKKRIDSYLEEVRGEEVLVKFGVTKCEIATNLIDVYNDGTKQIRSTSTKVEYNVEGYHATDAELYKESERIVAQNMECYEEILRQVNERRAEVGVAPLTLDLTMCKAATMRAIEMDYSGYYSHTRPDGSDCFSALDYVDFESSIKGENIAAGQMSASWVMASWTRSEGHYRNMIDPRYTKIGVGLSEVGAGGMRKYWCQMFAQ